ncbi:MAG: sugar ABC transporter permease, partial [Chloroflexota bacterium]|nr:sugar ABC transporter permease [Chloroflexota bacterium]
MTAVPVAPHDAPGPPRPNRSTAWRRNRAYVARLSPTAVLLALFFVAPAGWAVYASFTNRALLGV